MNVTLKQDIENVDWQALADVYRETLGPEDPAQLERTWSRSYATVLAYADGRLVGAGRAISDGEREALIVGVVVLPPYQGLGIGSAIMGALTEAVKGTAILLTVPDEENLSFYRKAGFRMQRRVMALGYRGDVFAE